MLKKLKPGNQVDHLESALTSIFPDIVVNSRPLRDPETGALIELDIWLPEYSVAFEYQDTHHYSTTWYFIKSPSQVKSADALARNQGITLVSVPCWPFESAALCATINFVRPDLILAYSSSPISLNPPQKFFEVSDVPGVGELMLASFYEGNLTSLLSESSWWMGEKYDGVRCMWNPVQSQLRGLDAAIPEVMETICQQTSMFFDCEVWAGRGMYLDAHRITLPYEGVSIDWPFVRMITFDDATPSTMDLVFEKRYELAVRVECASKRFLRNFSHGIFKDAGEGVILRRRASLYEHGRNSDLYKIKVSRGDAEALVVDILPQSKVKLKLPSGILFDAPSDMMMLKIGDVVTFEYNAVSRRELPVSPKIVRVRSDLSWRHVLSDHAQHPINSSSPPDLQKDQKRQFYTKPTGYWNDKELLDKARKLFGEFAHQRNLDPLVPETWYNTTHVEFNRAKSGYSIYSKFGGYIKSVLAAFPNIGLDVHKFSYASKGYWKNIDNRRQQLIQFAKRHNFDPLVAENWGKMYVKQIYAEENISWVRMYGGSFWKAMHHIFPNIGLENVELKCSPDGYWTPRTRKMYFDKFAKEQGFDPLIPKNWHDVDMKLLKKRPKIRAVIAEFGSGLGNTLLNTYPDIGLANITFTAKLNNFYIFRAPGLLNDPKTRREFFDTFAATNNFDPLIPENWYNKRRHDFKSVPYYNQVFSWLKGTFAEELMLLYPNIGLQKHKFIYQPPTTRQPSTP